MTLHDILEAIDTLSDEDRQRAIDSFPPRCLWCGSPSDRLCDTPLRGSSLEQIVTCDANVCASCSKQAMRVFCGSNGCDIDPSDTCPYCVTLLKQDRALPRATMPEEHRRRCRQSAKLHRQRSR